MTEFHCVAINEQVKRLDCLVKMVRTGAFVPGAEIEDIRRYRKSLQEVFTGANVPYLVHRFYLNFETLSSELAARGYDG